MDLLWLFDKRSWLLAQTSSGLAWFVVLKYNFTETHKENQNMVASKRIVKDIYRI